MHEGIVLSRKPALVLAQAAYESIMEGRQVRSIPELFDGMIKFWTSIELSRESDLRRLAQLIPSDLDPLPGRIPFVLVPDFGKKPDLGKLMRLVWLNGQSGESDLQAEWLTDHERAPEGPYLAFDAEDGRDRLNHSPIDSYTNLRLNDRRPYLTVEGICHAAMFPVMAHHHIDLVGSESQLGGRPWISTGKNGQPVLTRRWSNLPNPRCGAPSFGGRKGLQLS